MTKHKSTFLMKIHKRILVAGGLVLPVQTYAHHVTGGQRPQTFEEGLLSGLAHPVIGLDHFLFLLMAGVLAYSLQSPSRYVLPALVVASALFGTSLHLAEISVPRAEILITLSVIVSGGLVWSQRRVGAAILSLFFAGAGVFHGYAYAESVIGGETTPLVAYLIGLALIQFAVMAGAMICLGKLYGLTKQTYAVGAERFAGVAALGGGAVILALSFS